MAIIINGTNTPTAGAVAVGDGTTLAFTAAGSSGHFFSSGLSNSRSHDSSIHSLSVTHGTY